MMEAAHRVSAAVPLGSANRLEPLQPVKPAAAEDGKMGLPFLSAYSADEATPGVRVGVLKSQFILIALA